MLTSGFSSQEPILLQCPSAQAIGVSGGHTYNFLLTHPTVLYVSVSDLHFGSLISYI